MLNDRFKLFKREGIPFYKPNHTKLIAMLCLVADEFQINIYFNDKKVRTYDQELPQSHTADQLTTP